MTEHHPDRTSDEIAADIAPESARTEEEHVQIIRALIQRIEGLHTEVGDLWVREDCQEHEAFTLGAKDALRASAKLLESYAQIKATTF
jgi:hypothetical protein